MLKTTKDCNNNYTDICERCFPRDCSRVPLIEHILASEDIKKITNLNNVLSKYQIHISDYITPMRRNYAKS